MATTITLPEGLNPEDLFAAIQLMKQTAPVTAPVPSIPAITVTPDAPTAAKKTRKKTAPAAPTAAPIATDPISPVALPSFLAAQPVAIPQVSIPVAAAPPVTGMLPNGMKANGTPAYQAMVQFMHVAIRKLAAASTGKKKSKGIHTRYSGINDAFGQYFSLAKEQVFKVVDAMVERGDLQRHPAKGGFMLYVPGDMPTATVRRTADETLALILG